jgi:hypothetical protein
MPRAEIRGTRDLTYSTWRRKISDECLAGRAYVTDIDGVEWRAGRGIVAFIETARNSAVNKSKWQLDVYRELTRRTGAPSYLVVYQTDEDDTDPIWQFKVINLASNKTVTMSRSEYLNFLRGL